MTDEIKNQAWAAILPEAREEARREYDLLGRRRANEAANALGNIFGHHNLTSDTEPSELLFVEREKVQELYDGLLNEKDAVSISTSYGVTITARMQILQDLFGDKCLPDKEPSVQVEPKFKVGDKVWCKPHKCVAEIDIIGHDVKKGQYHLKFYGWFKPEDIEPYNDPETKDMEEKELNLAVLIKGCEGEILYSRAYGEVTLNEIVCDDRPNSQEIKCYTPDPQSDRIWFLRNGRKHKNGEIDLYPSRALYEKYPLGAKKAWEEWAESRKPKRWRNAKVKSYWFIDSEGQIEEATDVYDKYDNNRYEFGNYFKDEQTAEQAAEAVKECLARFHEQNAEK